jgi:hypothetical protein
MPEDPPQHQGSYSLAIRLWQAFLVALWRWHPGQAWHFTLQEAPFRGHSGRLRSGCYLFCIHSPGVDAVAIKDQLHPERRIPWLLTPGWNILWIRLRQQWSQPVFEWLSGKQGVKPDVTLAAKRTWGALGLLPSLARLAISRRMINLEVAQYCVLWPTPQPQCDDPWYRWALSIPELVHLNLEDRALRKGCAKAAPLPALNSIFSIAAQASRRARLGIVAHLHYLDLWPEIRDALLRSPPDARLFLTISEDALPSGDITVETVTTEVAADRPQALVRISPNRGRDIGPFMQLLAQGAFDELDCVCKIHGKKSLRDDRQALFGDVWRQYAVETLLPNPESIERTGRYFMANPQLGILGPGQLRLPRRELESVLDRDYGLLRELLLSRFGRDFTNRTVFFAGTMFWFRPEALRLLRHPPQGGWPFPPEPAPDAGSLAHALERLLPTSALIAGYSVESLPDTERILPGSVSRITPA